MDVPFTKAFEVWENEFRANPERFMTAEQVAAAAVLPLSEQRAVYFVAILNRLANGKPWNTIAADAGSQSQEATNTQAAAPDGAAARESELASCAERVRAAWTAVEVAEAQHKRLEEAERVAFRAASDARAMLRHTGDVLLRAAAQGSA